MTNTTPTQFRVLAFVRNRGAIGQFYVHEFHVAANDTDAAKNEWFKMFSPDWELNHFTVVQPVEGGR